MLAFLSDAKNAYLETPHRGLRTGKHHNHHHDLNQQGKNVRSLAEADKSLSGVSISSSNLQQYAYQKIELQVHRVADSQSTSTNGTPTKSTPANSLASSTNKPVSQPVAASNSPATFGEDDFSPEAVISRVMGFIEQRLATEKANGASDEELEALYLQALSGVEKGLSEAKDVLSASGMLTGEVKDDFNATVDGLADALTQLGEDEFGLNADQADPRIAEFSQQKFLSSEQRSFSMTVLTQDGDEVELVISAERQTSSNNLGLNLGKLNLSAQSFQQTSAQQLDFKVKGELDSGEIGALTDLFQQVNELATKFYQGDVEQAFEDAMNMGFDAGELAGFSLDLKQTINYSAQNTYRDIAGMGQGPAVAKGGMNRLQDFAGQVADLKTGLADSLQRIGNGQDLLKGLLNRLPNAADSESPLAEHFSRFVGRLMD